MLADDIKTYYEEMELPNIASIHQIQRILLGSRFEFSVICQITFFLKIKPDELTNPHLTNEQINKEKNSHYMKDTSPVDWNELDAKTAPILEKLVKEIYNGTHNKQGRPERVSERLVYKEIGLLCHQLENMPKCKNIFLSYTESYPEKPNYYVFDESLYPERETTIVYDGNMN